MFALTEQGREGFDQHYDDQTDAWAQVRSYAWPFSLKAVQAASKDTLTLRP